MRLKETVHDRLPQKLLTVLFLLVLFFLSSQNIEANLKDIFGSFENTKNFLVQFIDVDWYFFSELIQPMIATIAMSIAGTFLGTLFAVPAAFLGTQIITRNRVVTILFRLIFSLIRTIPNLLLAAIFVAIVGIGEVTGVLTIAVFTFGMLAQLVYAEIETIKTGPLEANDAVGATRFQNALTAVWPQINTSVFRYILYAFEVNIRASAVLGYVGAGGIGVMLNTSLGFRQYGRVSLIILFILIVVTGIDLINQYLREEVIQ